ncbi:hypothetical protein GCM10022288_27730 [Gryllotalpicola kribbensis]|uniref:N-acetyltransferase domain-containing protein n=1 Tax=Gryllotalpicola kribbensis TaxID=993084 RepID=A0ABP8AYG9_9MICO
MSVDVRVMRADDPQRAHLEADGWVAIARSWGAALDLGRADPEELSGLAARADALGSVRELGQEDVDAVLELDVATTGDYPGSIATQHEVLERSRATPSATRAAWGFHTPDRTLAAVTFVDIDGDRVEIDFTVVARAWRGKGVGTGLKASAVLALLHRGVRAIRTGGSADNPAIIAANKRLGFTIDEEWVTLQRAAL